MAFFPNPPRVSSLRHRALRSGRRIRTRWRIAPGNLRASALLLTGLFCFAVMVTGIKYLGPGVALSQLLVIRQLMMMVMLAPLFIRDPGGALRTAHPCLQLLRGLCTLGSMYFGFLALRHIPLAEATAFGFSQVLFVTILAVVILKERVSAARWLATAVGFAGVLIMLRPGTGELNLYVLATLLAALFGSGTTISVRMLSAGEKTATILVWQGLVLLVVLAVPAWVQWVALSPVQWLMMGLIGITGTMGQFFLTRAYQAGEAASLAPLDFARLPMHSVIGIWLFAEYPHPATLLGAALIIGSTIFVIRSNAAAGRQG